MTSSREVILSIIGKDVSGSTALKGVGTSAEQTESKIGGLNKGMQTAMAVGGTAAVAFAAKSTSAFLDVGSETIKLQRYMGGTAEDASRLRFAAQQTGTDIDALASAMGKASKAMDAGKFDKYGIAVKDAAGNARPMKDILLDTADVISKMPAGFERTAAAQALFGKAGADMIPFLSKGSEGLQKLMGETDQYGLVLSGDNLQAVKNAKEAQRQLSAEWEGVQVQIGERVLPMVTAFTGALAHIPGPIMDIVVPLGTLAGGLGGVALIGSKIATGIAPAVGMLSGLATKLNESDGIAGRAVSSLGGVNQVLGAAGIAAAGAAVGYELISNRLKQAADYGQGLADVAMKASQSKNWDELADQLGRVNAQAAAAGQEAANASGPFEQFYKKDQEEARDKLIEVSHALEARMAIANNLAAQTGDNRDKTLAWLEAEEKAGRTYASITPALAAYTGNIDQNTMSAKEAADATEGYTDKIKEQNDTLHASIDPLFAVTSALESNAQAAATSTKANGDLWLAQVEYNKLPTAENLAKVNAAILAKQQADEGAVRPALDVTTAQNTLTGAIQTGTVTIDGAKAMLGQWVAAGLITQAQAQQVGAKFGWVAAQANTIPASKHTVVTADTSQFEAAMARANAAGRAGVFFSSLNTPNPLIGQHADGSNLNPGWNLLGEEGPELANTNTGQVLTARQTSRMMSSGGGDTYIINVHTLNPTREAGAVIVDAIRDLYAGPGTRPLPREAIPA